jgi:hypothetical protein
MRGQCLYETGLYEKNEIANGLDPNFVKFGGHPCSVRAEHCSQLQKVFGLLTQF